MQRDGGSTGLPPIAEPDGPADADDRAQQQQQPNQQQKQHQQRMFPGMDPPTRGDHGVPLGRRLNFDGMIG